jgi:UDP-glucose 4-epimerase
LERKISIIRKPIKSTKSILVTGGAGYIGSHVCKALAAAGYFPVVFDNLVYGHTWAVKWGPLVIGALADKELLSQSIKKFQISAVIHLAAYAYVGESVINPAQEVVGKKINYSVKESRPGDPAILIADASKAKSVLGWNPKYSSSMTILEHAWNWQRTFPGAFSLSSTK